MYLRNDRHLWQMDSDFLTGAPRRGNEHSIVLFGMTHATALLWLWHVAASAVQCTCMWAPVAPGDKGPSHVELES